MMQNANATQPNPAKNPAIAPPQGVVFWIVKEYGKIKCHDKWKNESENKYGGGAAAFQILFFKFIFHHPLLAKK